MMPKSSGFVAANLEGAIDRDEEVAAREPPAKTGCVGAWSLRPAQIAIAKKVFTPSN